MNNNNYISPHYQAHKKRLQSEDFELSSFGLPRKKFISEESFANEMAAMSLHPSLQTQQQQQQQQYYQFYGNRFESNFNPLSTRQHDKNVVRIDHLSDDENEDTDIQMQSNDTIYVDVNGKKAIINGYLNGLPLELRPGEHKPRIPDFVLKDPE
ncbi:hypothetical protein BD408DRAFT_425551 [Parasitella parasitica]|nr:hypothetical protein BD408DRAFT_425551 [Parasitella parasitica]